MEKWLDGLATMHIRVWWLLVSCNNTSFKCQEFRKNTNFPDVGSMAIAIMWLMLQMRRADITILSAQLVHLTSTYDILQESIQRAWQSSGHLRTLAAQVVPSEFYGCYSKWQEGTFQVLKNTLSWGRFDSHCSLCNFRRQKRYWSAESIYACETIFIRHTQE